MKKYTFIIGIVWCLSLINCFTTYAGQWKKNDTGWWYTFNDGSYPTKVWLQLEDKYYYFDETGYMVDNGLTADGFMVDKDGCLIGDFSVITDYVLDTMDTGYYVKGDGYYFYGDLIPDTERFSLTCCADSIYHNGWTEYNFYADGTYKKVVREHTGQVTLKGVYKRNENVLELKCKTGYSYEYKESEIYDKNRDGELFNVSDKDNETFAIECGRMWLAD